MPAAQLEAVVVDDAAFLRRYAPEWDALAQASGRPYMAPALQLAWWEAARTGDARLRCVAVLEAGRLVGIAPTFAQVGALGLAEYRFLGAGSFHRIEPLAAAGREREVAHAIARRLCEADPTPSSIVLEGFDAQSRWPELLRGAWPGRVQYRRDLTMPAPVVAIDGGFDAWMAGRSSNFREKMRYRRRRLIRAGATWRLSASPADVTDDLAAMYRLHHARWERRGGSGALSPGLERTLSAAGQSLVSGGRLRLWTMEVDGAPIAASLFVAAGREVAYWGGGMDPGWEREAPGVQLLLIELEDAFARGAARLDLGGGLQDYKQRFTADDASLSWQTLFPVGARWPLTRAQLAPKHARTAARTLARRLSPEQQAQLKRLLTRDRPGRPTR